MRNREFHSLFILLLIVLFTSCSQEASDDFMIIQTESELINYAIEIHNDQILMVGGDSWQQCDLSTSEDGRIWNTTYFTNRALFDLHVSKSNLFAVGTSGYFFKGDDVLLKKEISTSNQLRAITDAKDFILTIAGKDFNKGWTYTLDQNLEIIKEHFFNQELSDVKCDENFNCIAVGYGIILSSADQGLNWTRSNQTGDFYKSLDYNSNGTPYVVGHEGSILYSLDQGSSWNTLQSGHSPLGKNPNFRKIKFYNEIGYIVGNNGIIWKSENDGNSWQDISIKTDLDLLDFVIYNGELIIAAEEGKVIILDS